MRRTRTNAAKSVGRPAPPPEQRSVMRGRRSDNRVDEDFDDDEDYEELLLETQLPRAPTPRRSTPRKEATVTRNSNRKPPPPTTTTVEAVTVETRKPPPPTGTITTTALDNSRKKAPPVASASKMNPAQAASLNSPHANEAIAMTRDVRKSPPRPPTAVPTPAARSPKKTMPPPEEIADDDDDDDDDSATDNRKPAARPSTKTTTTTTPPRRPPTNSDQGTITTVHDNDDVVVGNDNDGMDEDREEAQAKRVALAAIPPTNTEDRKRLAAQHVDEMLFDMIENQQELTIADQESRVVHWFALVVRNRGSIVVRGLCGVCTISDLVLVGTGFARNVHSW
jgi:hypothetical protein